jgi:hypothetical protein
MMRVNSKSSVSGFASTPEVDDKSADIALVQAQKLVVDVIEKLP